MSAAPPPFDFDPPPPASRLDGDSEPPPFEPDFSDNPSGKTFVLPWWHESSPERQALLGFGIAALGFGLYCPGWVAAWLAARPIIKENWPPPEVLERTLWFGLFAAVVCPAVAALWSKQRAAVLIPGSIVAATLVAPLHSETHPWGWLILAAVDFSIFCAIGNIVRKSDSPTLRQCCAVIGIALIVAGVGMRWEPGSIVEGLVDWLFWAQPLRLGTTLALLSALPAAPRPEKKST